ncbi:MAG TPA: GntR family transcriptional regulator, partial [Anaerolineales bacterium]|nr:GntR family transcriptional regulator [Anaerolineales bacterium]
LVQLVQYGRVSPMIRLDPRSSDPIYLQVVEQIKHLIAVGQLKPADQLPTVRQLAVELRVNPNTVARAYTQLAEEGVISTQQGRGTYVLEMPPPADQRRLRREKLVTVVDAFLRDAERMGYAPVELEKVLNDRFAVWQRVQTKKS